MEEKLVKIYIIFFIVSSAVADLKDKKIIIIGAGPSGIAAATRLIENGIKNIQILEAENRIGGRIHTIPFGDNVVDMGAHMCDGQVGNVVWDMAKNHDLIELYSIKQDQLVFTNSNGTKIELEKSQKLFKLFEEILEMKEMADYEGSLGNFWMEKYNQKIQDKEFQDIEADLLRDFPGIIEHQENSLDATESWYHTSSKAIAAYDICEGEHALFWKEKGFVVLFDLLQRKIPASSPNKIEISDYIHFNKQVKKIDYRAKNEPVRIECADSTVYEADHVICTVSLGVLKANHLSMFDPFLPWEKVNSIEGMGFGALGVINIEFERAFWPKDWTGIFPRWLPNELREIRASKETRWLEGVFPIMIIDYQSKSLIAWHSGPSVREMEELSEDVVGQGIIKMLKMFAPDLDVPEKPVNTKRSSWTQNPNFLGTYSYHSLESDGVNATNHALATPILDDNGFPLLQFGGEHTCIKEHYATVHGAIEAGWREADRLLQAYNNALKN